MKKFTRFRPNVANYGFDLDKFLDEGKETFEEEELRQIVKIMLNFEIPTFIDNCITMFFFCHLHSFLFLGIETKWT